MTSLRLQAYRQLLLLDTLEDHSIQDYQSRWHEAQHTVKTLFQRLDTHGETLPLEEKAEILLTIFVLLQVGYRNEALFARAVEATYELLPQLTEATKSPETPILNSQSDNCCPLSVVRCPLSILNCPASAVNRPLSVVRCLLSIPNYQTHLLVHLYQETQDEELLPAIDHLMSTWQDDTMAEEDHYLMELFQLAETA